MSNKRYKNASDKRDGGGHVAIPFVVLDSIAYLSLGAYGRMLLWDLASQYRGNNNGDLCAAWKVMKKRGWRSEATLHKSKQQLLEVQLIVETRKGHRPNKCSLFALTWYALDDCGGKLDITARGFPRGAYKLKNPPLQLIKNGSLTTVGVVKNSG